MTFNFCEHTPEGNGSDSDKEDSISEAEGHKSIVQQPLSSERDDGVAQVQEFEDATVLSDTHCECAIKAKLHSKWMIN